jgi:hypothetical protein
MASVTEALFLQDPAGMFGHGSHNLRDHLILDLLVSAGASGGFCAVMPNFPASLAKGRSWRIGDLLGRVLKVSKVPIPGVPAPAIERGEFRPKSAVATL